MKIKLRILSIMMIIIIFLSHERGLFILLLAAAIHEIGHIFVARVLRIELKELNIGIFGAGLSCDTSALSYSREVLLCIGGPALNLICALF